jgi:DNA-binding response OmpR family regulator
MTRRVLIVDDNADLAENLRELLELEGFDVAVFTSPTEALARKDELAFDAALLDIRMPGIDGIELCSALGETHPRATFVLMTAFTTEKRLRDAESSGASAVLKKPLPLDRLLSLLGAVDAATVLLVEDDAALRSGVVELLSPHGYAVSEAQSLAQARSALARARPDAAIVDLKLPDGSGAVLARELLDHGVHLVLTTAFDEALDESVATLRREGAHYLGKPFAPSTLLALLSDAAREMQA